MHDLCQHTLPQSYLTPGRGRTYYENMRIDDKRTKMLAKDFIRSTRARLWNFVTDDVRHALIDAAVMDCIRLADAVENQAPLTPAELVLFRCNLIAALHRGVPMGSTGRQFLRFDADDGTFAGMADAEQEKSA